MKKLLSFIFSFIFAIILCTSLVSAQTYEQLTKDYCGINVNTTTYSGGESLTLEKTNFTTSDDGWKATEVKLTKATLSGGGESKTFTLDQVVQASQVSAGGATFLLPGMKTFFEDTTKTSTTSTNFDIALEKQITYQNTDPSKPIPKTEPSCESQKAAAIIVPAKAQQQANNQAQANPTPGAQQAQPGPQVPYATPTDVYCIKGSPSSGIDTAIGCIKIETTQETVSWLMGWVIGIAGGIAFLLIIWSGIQIMTAGGDPQKLNAGREVLTAAISGLIFIIFSVFLLRLIGLDILRLGSAGL